MNDKLKEKIIDWMNENILSPSYLDIGDWESIIDSDLTFSENIKLLIDNFPTLWKSSEDERAKQLVLRKELIEKMLRNEKHCTYRPYKMSGKYFVVSSRFQSSDKARALIDVFRSEKIDDPNEITDEEVNSFSATSSRDELFENFKKWYPEKGISAIRYRNWFRILEEIPA